VVAVALSAARQLGPRTLSCASTGNLANAVAAAAARAGMGHVVVIPADLEAGTVIAAAVYGGVLGGAGQLRRRQPAVLGAHLRPVDRHMGLRQRQPAALVNHEHVRFEAGLDTATPAGAQVAIVPAAAGG
jgi:hypothetical protein